MLAHMYTRTLTVEYPAGSWRPRSLDSSPQGRTNRCANLAAPSYGVIAGNHQSHSTSSPGDSTPPALVQVAESQNCTKARRHLLQVATCCNHENTPHIINTFQNMFMLLTAHPAQESCRKQVRSHCPQPGAAVAQHRCQLLPMSQPTFAKRFGTFRSTLVGGSHVRSSACIVNCYILQPLQPPHFPKARLWVSQFDSGKAKSRPTPECIAFPTPAEWATTISCTCRRHNWRGRTQQRSESRGFTQLNFEFWEVFDIHEM